MEEEEGESERERERERERESESGGVCLVGLSHLAGLVDVGSLTRRRHPTFSPLVTTIVPVNGIGCSWISGDILRTSLNRPISHPDPIMVRPPPVSNPRARPTADLAV